MIFFCNIPFIFFAGKTALIAVIHQCFYQKKVNAIAPAAQTEIAPDALTEDLLRTETE